LGNYLSKVLFTIFPYLVNSNLTVACNLANIRNTYSQKKQESYS